MSFCACDVSMLRAGSRLVSGPIESILVDPSDPMPQLNLWIM